MSKVKFNDNQLEGMRWNMRLFNMIVEEDGHNNAVEFYDRFTSQTRGETTKGINGKSIIYPTLGLSGEAGEVADKIKKIIRDNDSIFDQEHKDAIAEEIGDVLWYVTQLSRDLGFSLTEIMKMNMDKLYSRAERDVISGSGDER